MRHHSHLHHLLHAVLHAVYRVGWTCGVAMAYHFILAPMIEFAVNIAGIQVTLPEFDFSQLSTILMAMLGMAGLRTYEKQKKVAKGDD